MIDFIQQPLEAQLGSRVHKILLGIMIKAVRPTRAGFFWAVVAQDYAAFQPVLPW